jgi:hypothetical protein
MIDTNNAAIASTHPHLAAFGAWLDEMNRESARGAALTAAAMLDTLYLDILKAFLIDGKQAEKLLTGFNAPLGTMGARAAAAASMGLITKAEFEEAELIRKVRNEFAHGVHVSFETPSVKSLCKRLNMDAKPYGDIKWDPRTAFVSATMSVMLKLNNRAAYVKKHRLAEKDWPI